MSLLPLKGAIHVMATQAVQIQLCDRYEPHELIFKSPSDVCNDYVKDCLSYS